MDQISINQLIVVVAIFLNKGRFRKFYVAPCEAWIPETDSEVPVLICSNMTAYDFTDLSRHVLRGSSP